MGDGDTKSYVNVKDTYPGNEIKKLVCFGHCKKSWNTIMKSKKKERGLGDRGCPADLLLTDYRIMQVLPANKMLDTLKVWHQASSNKDNSYYYPHCPIGSNSWCKYNADRANNTQTYTRGLGLPKEIIYIKQQQWVREIFTW